LFKTSRCFLALSTILAGLACLLPPLTLNGQTAVPDASGRLVFKTTAQTVVLDIVVTGRDGPVEGLRKEDFLVTENGHPQTLTYFEEHTRAKPAQAQVLDQSPLPPNVFTNVPRTQVSEPVTVLLLDSLNTGLRDQSVVHAQILKSLKTLQPGSRMAIFVLGARLRLIEGFTDDVGALVEALSDPKLGASGPQMSPLLQTRGDSSANQQATALLQQSLAANSSPAVADALSALTQFQAEQNASRQGTRINLTLDAFQQLAHYLAGIPGRKNVVWFSSAFPQVLFPDPDLKDSFAVQRDFGEEIKRTNALLAAAQVAVYPVASEGLATDSLYDTETQLTGVESAFQAQQQAIGPLQGDAKDRNARHAAMDAVAEETGGIAVYNTNGLGDAIAHIADHGSCFYTVTYTPSNTSPDGRFHKIQVKLPRGRFDSYKLAYRRGYYAVDPKETELATANGRLADPLHPFMGPGMPDSTELSVALRVQRGTTRAEDPSLRIQNQSSPNLDQAGDNPNLKGALTRYSVDFVVAAKGLQLGSASDGSHHGRIEATLVVYDRQGKALNWSIRQVNLDMDPARFALVQANGVNFNLQIDATDAAATIRGGVIDLASNWVGTLEIPLSKVIGIRP